MVQEHVVEGFEALQKKLKEVDGGSSSIFILYSGSLGPDGSSWCPDCNVADPVIDKSIHMLPESAIFIRCHVGQRDYWKDQSNPFRTEMGINSVPTLLKWGPKKKKLEEAQCADSALVEMLFEDEE